MKFEPFDSIRPAPPDEERGESKLPVRFISEDSAWFGTIGYVWIVTESYDLPGDYGIDFHIDSEVPYHPEGWLPWEIEGAGLPMVITGESGGAFFEYERWMLEHGIAPGQRFFVRLDLHAWKMETYYGTEYDYKIDMEVLQIEPWPEDRIAEAWINHLKMVGYLTEDLVDFP